MKTKTAITTIKLVYSAACLAIAIVLPFATGQIPEIGNKLCPMHFPVMLCGFICGWPYGLTVGLLAAPLRFLLFSAPPFPNFFFMMYKNYSVQNFILIPNHFFTPEIIIKRNPLGSNARRAGWTGCNIDISSIPESGKIFLVKNKIQIEPEKVIASYKKTKTLKTNSLESRGWILDVLNSIEKIPNNDFTLNEVYKFEDELKLKHPLNNFIKDKIRQQLQYLRDKGFIEFISPGHYKKI